MRWAVNSNPQAQVESEWQTVITRFLELNNRSVLVAMQFPFAAIYTPGLTVSEVRRHVIACILTAGLWVPVFAVIAILRTPKTYLIDASDPAGIFTWELDV